GARRGGGHGVGAARRPPRGAGPLLERDRGARTRRRRPGRRAGPRAAVPLVRVGAVRVPARGRDRARVAAARLARAVGGGGVRGRPVVAGGVDVARRAGPGRGARHGGAGADRRDARLRAGRARAPPCAPGRGRARRERPRGHVAAHRGVAAGTTLRATPSLATRAGTLALLLTWPGQPIDDAARAWVQ